MDQDTDPFASSRRLSRSPPPVQVNNSNLSEEDLLPPQRNSKLSSGTFRKPPSQVLQSAMKIHADISLDDDDGLKENGLPQPFSAEFFEGMEHMRPPSDSGTSHMTIHQQPLNQGSSYIPGQDSAVSPNRSSSSPELPKTLDPSDFALDEEDASVSPAVESNLSEPLNSSTNQMDISDEAVNNNLTNQLDSTFVINNDDEDFDHESFHSMSSEDFYPTPDNMFMDEMYRYENENMCDNDNTQLDLGGLEASEVEEEATADAAPSERTTAPQTTPAPASNGPLPEDTNRRDIPEPQATHKMDTQQDHDKSNHDKTHEKMKSMSEEIERLRKENDTLRRCVYEYKTTMSVVTEEKQKLEKNLQISAQDVIQQRDQAIEDLQSVEKAFSDLHRRFEKSKQVLEIFKKNEDTLKQCVQEYQARLKRNEQKYLTLKQHAEDKLESANIRIEEQKRTSEDEIIRLQAALRKSDLEIRTLTSQVEQKTRENVELTSICDELLPKVGR